jgi:hypothetical protein
MPKVDRLAVTTPIDGTIFAKLIHLPTFIPYLSRLFTLPGAVPFSARPTLPAGASQ